MTTSNSTWERAAGKVVTLVELMEFLLPVLPLGLFSSIVRIQERLRHLRKVDDMMRDNIRDIVFVPAGGLVNQLALIESEAALGRLQSLVLANKEGDPVRVLAKLEEFHQLLLSELRKHGMFIVPKDDLKLYNNDRALGDAVYHAFPSARMDIREAANCLVFGRYNAAVHHLMNAAEIGLRALARDRSVELNWSGKDLPIELAQWGELIRAIRDKVDAIRKWAPSLQREEALRFYNGALTEVSALNDGVRRHIAHGRFDAYHPDDARAQMSHVRRFLEGLSRHVSETKTTPEIWI